MHGYWFTDSPHADVNDLKDFPKLTRQKKRWSSQNPLFRLLLRKKYLEPYVTTYKRMDQRIFYAYAMYEGVVVCTADDMYQILADRWYEIDRTLPDPEPPTTAFDVYDRFSDCKYVDRLRDLRVEATALHARVTELCATTITDHDNRQHVWHPFRVINGQYRMMARRRDLGLLFREHFEQYFAGVLGPLDDLKRALHEHEQKRPWALNQYCTCCNCVRGLVHKRMKFAYIS